MFPSSDPATQEELNWRHPGYPGDQQNTQFQWIAGNGIGGDSENLDDLFDDDCDGEDEAFSPGGGTQNVQAHTNPTREQTTHEILPLDWARHYRQPSGPRGHQPHRYHESLIGQSRVNRHGHSSTYTNSNLEASSNGLFQHHDRHGVSGVNGEVKPPAESGGIMLRSPDGRATIQYADGPQPPSRQHSLKPDAPYPGYSRNPVTIEPQFHGASDIPRPRAASSNMDDLFSDDEDAVGEPEPTAAVPDENKPAVKLTGGVLEGLHAIGHMEPIAKREQVDEEEFLEVDYSEDNESEEGNENDPASPTDSQLEKTRREDSDPDLLKPRRNFPATASSSHQRCQCDGNPARCDCAPGHCGCSECPRSHSFGTDSGTQSNTRHAHVEGEQDDAPMDIGMTPITPRFPNVYDQYGIQKIPGLGQLAGETEDEDRPYHNSKRQKHQCPCGDDCQCTRGGCECPRLDDPAPLQYHQDRPAAEPLGWWTKTAAEAQTPSHHGEEVAPVPAQHEFDYANPPSSANERPYYTPQQGFSFVHSVHSSHANTPIDTPPHSTPVPPSRPDTPRPHDIDVRESVEPEMPLPNWHRESTPAYTDRSPSPSPVSRSPTSRHGGDFDAPNEMDRIDGIDDIAMRDSTPVPASRAFHRSREGSIAPRSPTHFSRSRLSVPRTSSPTMASSPTRHLMPASRSPRLESISQPSLRRRLPNLDTTTALTRASQSQRPIPAPPIPISTEPGLKTTKQRGKRKSAVHGSKVEKPKSRNATAKQTRKATEKIVKQDVKDIEEGAAKKGGKVAEAVAKIEESLQTADGGILKRRSARIRRGWRVGIRDLTMRRWVVEF